MKGRNILHGLLLVMVILSFSTTQVQGQAVCGDVNDDSTVNIVDALLLAQCYVGIANCHNTLIGDVNCADSINIIDALLVAQLYVGLISTLNCCDTPVIIQFPDPYMEAAVRDVIGKPEGYIYETDVNEINSFHANTLRISDISGIEYFVSLTYLSLADNLIVDISPLENLTSLRHIVFTENDIVDISPLENLTSLRYINLSENEIADISILANLTSLTELNLRYNQIVDISPIANLTSLTILWLNNNKIADISPLENLTSLNVLYLSDNQIVDISILGNLTLLRKLYLIDNQITTGAADLVTLVQAEMINLSENYDIPEEDLDLLEETLGDNVVIRPDET